MDSLDDQEVREKIANELSKNFLVEAAAGTGKTHCLESRMVNLVARGHCKIEQLVAVTFTRKAAAELRERFHGRMNQERRSEARSDKEQRRLAKAAERIDQAFIGTFHAFCSQLLRERPMEFRVDPLFGEVEDQEDISLRKSAWATLTNELHSEPGGMRLRRLNEVGLAANDLAPAFVKFAGNLDVHDWPHSPPPDRDFDAIRNELREYVKSIELLSPLFPEDTGSDQLMDLYRRIERKARHTDWAMLREFFELVELFRRSARTTLSAWHDKEVAKIERERWNESRGRVDPFGQWWAAKRYALVIELFQDARRNYNQLRAASGRLNFQDLLMSTARGLREHSHLRTYFQTRFTHLLVDEFQDTDPLQAEILAFLTSTNTTEVDWCRCKPRAGSLFLVGDPKQSIYRFRRADIATYQEVKKSLVLATGGEVLELSTSFRSLPEICDWTNRVFRQRFGEQATEASPAFVALRGGRETTSNGTMRGIFRLPNLPPVAKDEFRSQETRKRTGVDSERRQEADAIARYIRWAIDTRQTVPRTAKEAAQGTSEFVTAGDFMIIAKKKRALEFYAKALARWDIPNRVTGSQAFSQLSELRCLRQCLLAVDDARNPIHYVSLLRSELFGFSDADLYAIRHAGGRFCYMSEPPKRLAEPLRGRLVDANERCLRYLGWLRRLPFATAILRIAEDLGLVALAASRRDGNHRAGGLLAAGEWIRAHHWTFDSTQDAIAYLTELIENVEAEGCTALPGSSDVVRVLNLHKAKGLEAPIVFLVDAVSQDKAVPPEFHVERRAGVARGFAELWKNRGMFAREVLASPLEWKKASLAETRFLDAEADRLLYVAATRASCQLVVSTRPKSKGMGAWCVFSEFLNDQPELSLPKGSQLDLGDGATRHDALQQGSKHDGASVARDFQTGEFLPSNFQSQLPLTYAAVAMRRAGAPVGPAASTSDFPMDTIGSAAVRESVAVQKVLEATWDIAATPSHMVTSAKEIAFRGARRPVWHATGNYGHLWGTAIHELLELANRLSEHALRPHAVRLASELELGAGRTDELLATVAAVRGSDVWKRSRSARRCLVEVPFETIDQSPEQPGLVRGVIDLVFREQRGWVIVDYKSDEIQSDQLSEATKFYSKQLSTYASFWEQMVSEPVVERGLYFTRLNNYVVS